MSSVAADGGIPYGPNDEAEGWISADTVPKLLATG